MSFRKEAIRLTAIFTAAVALGGCVLIEDPRYKIERSEPERDTYQKIVIERKRAFHCHGKKKKDGELSLKNKDDTVAVGIVCNGRLLGVRLDF